MEGDSPASVEEAGNLVQKLYDFRDHYFESHDIERAPQKCDDVKGELHKVLEALEKSPDDIKSKVDFLLLRGKALNVVAEHSSEAQELLSKAVKKNPSLTEAWIQLGECYWKNGDMGAAKNCFSGALNHNPSDKVALRNLSMVLRQIRGESEDVMKNIEESVSKAKEAVQLDLKDGTSWFILGNAYLSLFFSGAQNPKILKQCMSAYQQAERDPVAANNPDLHFNRASAYKYQEDYEQAMADFNKAGALDPGWPEPKQNEKDMLDYLAKVQEFVQTKGQLKSRKIQNLRESIRDSQLGPYGGSPSNTDSVLKHVPLSSLTPDTNSNVVVLGKVVCTVHSDDPVPFTFCMVDREGTCTSVTVYNLVLGQGVKIGDSVTIPEPYLQPVNVSHKELTFQYTSIRVDNPAKLVVNGRKVGSSSVAPTVLAVSTKSE